MCGDVILEILRMPSAEEDLYVQYPYLEDYRDIVQSSYKASSRRMEILSEKVLLKKLFPDDNVILSHNGDGMPLLSNGMNISISHTKNHIAMILSEDKRVALDIEHISDRVKKVGRMYLRADEEFTEITEMLVAWCAKETMYKLYSSQNLSFEEIYIHPYNAANEGIIYADNLRTVETTELKYIVTEEYVLTTAVL